MAKRHNYAQLSGLGALASEVALQFHGTIVAPFQVDDQSYLQGLQVAYFSNRSPREQRLSIHQ